MMTSRRRGPWTPSTRSSSMSLVALGPLTMVFGRVPSSLRSALGSRVVMSAARTMQMWWSGMRLIARRPWPGPPSRMIVPVSATAAAQPVMTASTTSTPATDSGAKLRSGRLGIAPVPHLRNRSTDVERKIPGSTGMKCPGTCARSTPPRPRPRPGTLHRILDQVGPAVHGDHQVRGRTHGASSCRYLDYDIEIRGVICSTIESVNARYRRAIRARSHFPTEQTALKCLYLATRAHSRTLGSLGTCCGSACWANCSETYRGKFVSLLLA
jgi:hypothetical protein